MEEHAPSASKTKTKQVFSCSLTKMEQLIEKKRKNVKSPNEDQSLY